MRWFRRAGASAVLSARILCPVGILPHFWKGLRRVCRALEGDGADRNLPILEARPFRGVGGQFLDRHVDFFFNFAVRQRPRPRPMIC